MAACMHLCANERMSAGMACVLPVCRGHVRSQAYVLLASAYVLLASICVACKHVLLASTCCLQVHVLLASAYVFANVRVCLIGFVCECLCGCDVCSCSCSYLHSWMDASTHCSCVRVCGCDCACKYASGQEIMIEISQRTRTKGICN